MIGKNVYARNLSNLKQELYFNHFLHSLKGFKITHLVNLDFIIQTFTAFSANLYDRRKCLSSKSLKFEARNLLLIVFRTV